MTARAHPPWPSVPSAAIADNPTVQLYLAQFNGERAQALLQVLTSVLWIADPDGRFTSPQVLWGNYTGQSWEEHRDHGWLNAIHPDDRSLMLEMIEVAKVEPRYVYVEARLWHQASEAYRYYEARGVPILGDDGQVREWVGTCKDVDDQRRAQQALLRADRQKDEFIAVLAHELRNPLAPIRNAAHILKRKGNRDIQLAWTRDVIERQVAQMSHMLDDLLDISRVSQNKLELRKSRVTLDSILEMAMEISRPLFEQKGQHLELGILSSQIYIEADPHRLTQVFANLLNNAAKYTDPGGRISLNVKVEQGLAVVSVKDSGIGIAPEMRANIFQLFTQANPDPERSEGGLGIGLALARTLTQMHGGTIEARSEGLGHGSEFRVKLPLATARSADTHAGAAAQAQPVRLRILVADDNSDASETLAVLLELMGHEVRVARDGQEALDQCLADKPEVALLDIGMPKLSGYEVAQRLRAEQPGIFLVATTGWAQPEDVRSAAAAGFDRHCVKPMGVDELAQVLAQAGQRRP